MHKYTVTKYNLLKAKTCVAYAWRHWAILFITHNKQNKIYFPFLFICFFLLSQFSYLLFCLFPPTFLSHIFILFFLSFGLAI